MTRLKRIRLDLPKSRLSPQNSLRLWHMRLGVHYGVIILELLGVIVFSSPYTHDEIFQPGRLMSSIRKRIGSQSEATSDNRCDGTRVYGSQLDRISGHLVHVTKWFVLYQSVQVLLSRGYDRLSRRPKDLVDNAYRILQQEHRTPDSNATTIPTKTERLSLVLKALNIIGDGHDESVAHVLTILEDFHQKHGVVDLFAEYKWHDIVASIVVLSALQQRCRVVAADCAAARTNDLDLSIDDATLNDLAYYAVYASAAYGWKLEFAMRGRMHSADDTKALTQRTRVQRRDIIVAKWASTPRRPAYFLARDNERRSLVLSIRGTFSIDDILTDLCCTVAEAGFVVDTSLGDRFLSLLGYQARKMRSKDRVHSGMLQAAESLQNELSDLLRAELKTVEGSSLILVGHSMAGGVAALLGGLLSKEYPDLKVFAYGPAPCVSFSSTYQQAVDSRPQIVSAIFENDPFRSLSLQHVADLSYMLAKLCGDQQLRDSIMARLLITKRSRSNDAWLVSTRNSLRPPPCRNKLYPPGRLCLLSRCKRQRKPGVFHLRPLRRRLVVAEVEHSFFEDLEIPSVTHFSLHAPISYEQSLRKVAQLRQEKQ